jgi:ankyrin repeat protein
MGLRLKQLASLIVLCLPLAAQAAPDEGAELLQVAQQGDVEAMKAMVAKDVDLSVSDAKGRNAMHYLAMRGAIGQMKLLSILQPDLALAEDVQGWSPLWLAYSNGHLQTAAFLLDNKLDHINRLSQNGDLLAFRFVENADALEATKDAIARGLNLFKRNAQGQLLHEAANAAGHEQSAALLEARYEAIIAEYQKKQGQAQ